MIDFILYGLTMLIVIMVLLLILKILIYHVVKGYRSLISFIAFGKDTIKKDVNDIGDYDEKQKAKRIRRKGFSFLSTVRKQDNQ